VLREGYCLHKFCVLMGSTTNGLLSEAELGALLEKVVFEGLLMLGQRVLGYMKCGGCVSLNS